MFDMATTLEYPTVNGVTYEYSSLEINLAPQSGGSAIYVGVKDISYKLDLKPTKVYGTSAQPLSRTRGSLDLSGAITLYKSEADAFIAQLGDGYLEAVFDIVVNYNEAGKDIITDRVTGCRITSPDNSHSQGADALVVKFDLDVMMIYLSDKNPLNQMLKGTTT